MVMTRTLRIQEKGAVFHVFSRGNLKLDILTGESHKKYFLDLLCRGAQKYMIDIFAFCIMDNHYHLSLRITIENLHEFMHFLGSSYANFLVRGGWVGHVFAGRYKAIRIDEEEYFLIVNRYIHLNPVEAGVVERPEDYNWSNYRDCINGTAGGWFDSSWLEEYFGCGSEPAGREYQAFVENALGEENNYPSDHKVVAQALLGSDAFLRRIKASIRQEKWSKGLIGHKELTRIPSLDEVLEAICEHLGIDSLEHGSYRADKRYRYACNLLIHMAREYTLTSFDDIAKVIGGIKENAASHRYLRFNKCLDEDKGMRARLLADEAGVLQILKSKGCIP
ncbi:MAG: hypothetical protein HPY75_02660 [Actinobacteria bacterium]|nr:hypothetical protein [Actinomycetota bacterium]